ncbi:hypothetical protein [Actinomadura sp. WMMB 499]|uniref:hypothetical protein n=1 Tax=Actinomadura sp. WMMB 499 TaxID=1219491 RepID=UPI001249239E|nr:hypothetical protein [Actinomadura sp. WMMB 499]QFG26544.1 hypothetical protein F7P10_40820 [Actinomadura sp. WMMB 499]
MRNMMRRSAVAGAPLPGPGARAACGDDEPAEEVSGAADGAFPVTIIRGLGETMIGSEPGRIVALGESDQAMPLSVGFHPVFSSPDAVERGSCPEIGPREFRTLRTPTPPAVPHLIENVVPKIVGAAAKAESA